MLTLLINKCSANWDDGVSLMANGFLSSGSVNRDSTGIAQSPMVVKEQSLVNAFYVVVGRIVKGPVSQVGRSFKECISDSFGHSRMVSELGASGNSHFPIPFLFVHGATVAPN